MFDDGEKNESHKCNTDVTLTDAFAPEHQRQFFHVSALITPTNRQPQPQNESCPYMDSAHYIYTAFIACHDSWQCYIAKYP